MSFKSIYILKGVDVASLFLNKHSMNSTFSLIMHLVQYPDLKFKASLEAFIVRSDRSHPPSHSAVSGQNVSQTRAKPNCRCRNMSPRLFLRTRAVPFFSVCLRYVLNSLVSASTSRCILKPLAQLQCGLSRLR